MSFEEVDVPLRGSPIGTRRSIRVCRFGAADSRPKAYIHAGLHADEAPGLLVAQHLLEKLKQADSRGDLAGQVVVVPYANPVGLAQFVNNEHLGRYDLFSGINFNRAWPDLYGPVAARVSGALGSDADDNAGLIRRAMHEALDEHPIGTELDSLRVTLLREACDADLVVDLHCDDEALPHVYLMAPHFAQGSDLAGELGCSAVLLADDAGGSLFSSSVYHPWLRLAAAFPEQAVPMACISATIELRGFADVSDALAEGDAGALFRVLQRHGYVAGDPGPAPAVSCEPAGLNACDIVRAPDSGIIVYRVGLGDRVKQGDAVADLVNVSRSAPDEVRRTAYARANGIVLSRRLRKLVVAGEVIAKVAGSEPLSDRQGYLLED